MSISERSSEIDEESSLKIKAEVDENLPIPPKRRRAKIMLCIVAASWGFFCAVERAIILPTLWLYFLNHFSKEAASTYYGITLAAFNLSLLIVSPIYGYLAYKGVHVKLLLVISNQFEIIGNIIYFVASEPWLVFFGRLIAGIGGGSEVPLYADIVRITTSAERTKYISTLLMARQFGLIVGPAFTLLLHPINFRFGEKVLNIYNGPGFFMAAVWALHTVVTLIIYPRIDRYGNVVDEDSGNARKDLVRNYIYKPTKKVKDDDLVTEDDTNNSNIMMYNDTGKETKPTFLESLKPYYKYTTITLLIILFSSYVSIMALESVMVPLTVHYFDWTEVEMSYVCLACGGFVVLVYLVLSRMSTFMNDKTLLLIGCIASIIAYIYLTVVACFLDKDQRLKYIILTAIGAAIHMIGMPFCVCSESLYTKTVQNVDSDHTQSVLRTVINIAILIGPFLGGSLHAYPAIVFAVMGVLIILPTVLFILRFTTFNYP